MSRLVDLTSHARYAPDLVQVACSKVTAARVRLDLSHADFAETLGHYLAWEPSANLIRSWERGVAAPPGDVLAACSLLVSEDNSEEKIPLPQVDFQDSGQASSNIDTDEMTVPCRSADGRIIWVTVSRRTFLLGGMSATAGLAVRPVARIPGQIAYSGDVSPVEHLRRMRQVLIDSDNLLGPGHIIPTVHEHIRVIRQLRTTRSGADGRALLHLQAEFAEFGGWLHQDSGDFAQAQFMLDRALEWSHAVGDHDMTVYVMARKSQLAGDMRDSQGAVDLADAALALAEPGSRLHAAAQTYKGYGHALAGESTQALTALDEAARLRRRR